MRRGFFDECHNGEIDPGYLHLYQGGNVVGEAWASNSQIEVLFYGSYQTPGKAGPSVDVTFVVKATAINAPPIANSIDALKKQGTAFTYVRYGGTIISNYP